MTNLAILGLGALSVLIFGGIFFGRRGRKNQSDDGWDDDGGQSWTAGLLRGGTSVTVNVDPVRCARFGFCEHEAPDVFQIRREGRLTYRPSIKSDQLEPVIRAKEVCPARAIFLGKIPSSLMVERRQDRVGANVRYVEDYEYEDFAYDDEAYDDPPPRRSAPPRLGPKPPSFRRPGPRPPTSGRSGSGGRVLI